MHLDDLFAPADQTTPAALFAALEVQSAFSQIYSNPYEPPQIERVSLHLDSIPERRVATVESAWSAGFEEESEAMIFR